jgi:hypothetical protein
MNFINLYIQSLNPCYYEQNNHPVIFYGPMDIPGQSTGC